MQTKARLSKVVCIGGGTGTFVALKGLKEHPLDLTAIVTMADSGGSNKRIRDEFGLLPTSDIRQCFVALADENGGAGLMRQLFMYRFEKGQGIAGMTFGNLFIAALADILGSQAEAIRQTRKVLRIKGKVIPVSYTDTNLSARYEDGHVVGEEHLIDEPEHDGTINIEEVFLTPKASATPEALEAIRQADLIVLGPGDLYTSLIPNLLVEGIPEALSHTKAIVVYVLNLMTKYGQTYQYTAADHLKALERYINQRILEVLVNTAAIPTQALNVYAKSHEVPVVDDLVDRKPYRLYRTDLVVNTLVTKSKSDELVRSLIRHDSTKLANALIHMLQSHRYI
ncbi:uridine diphosphate-N-acetylglucosamine-binding protein YvcK [Candidatus Gottesmanbacteria bacterium]|nr:uridine diphosphate-N-acetylglucosamine-binding protein YvcK [Candidatus Gottesmanbacteria bacterium]